ncbi:hypothetical protein WDW86_16045 [Bdellovibrionota bacterium FG-2]
MSHISTIFAFITALSASIGAISAHAVDLSNWEPMIEVGTEGTLESENEMTALLRVGFGFKRKGGEVTPIDTLGPERMVWAKINGTFALASRQAGTLPSMNIEFIPYEDQLLIGEMGGEASGTKKIKVMGNLQLFPTQIKREVSLDQELVVRIAVVGVQVKAAQKQSAQTELYAQIAADFIGYKVASHVSELATFKGIHVAELGAEAGIGTLLSKSLYLKIGLGGSADFNFLSSIQSDQKAYLAVRLDIAQLVQLYVQGSVKGNWDSRNLFYEGGSELMAGVVVYWD